MPAYFIMSSFGLFQNEKVLVHYKLAIEVKDKKYDAWPLISSYTAIDKKGTIVNSTIRRRAQA